MEERRTRRGNSDEAEESKAKSTKRPRGERSVNDEEVEEFFAILKRLQDVKKLKNGLTSGDDGRRCKMTWQPAFTLDDFKDVTDGLDRNDSNEQDHCQDKEVVSRSFDLNAEPEVESRNG